MDRKVLDCIARTYPEKLTGRDRELFLRALKSKPDVMAELVENCIVLWCYGASTILGKGVAVTNIEEDVPAIIGYFENYFSEELEKLPP